MRYILDIHGRKYFFRKRGKKFRVVFFRAAGTGYRKHNFFSPYVKTISIFYGLIPYLKGSFEYISSILDIFFG